MKLRLLKTSALALLRALAVQSNEDVPASSAGLKAVASGAAQVTVERNGALNDCLDDCDRDRGGSGNNGWEACRAGCEADYGVGRRRSARNRIDDWDTSYDSDRARARRDDRIDRRIDNGRRRRSDRRDRIDKYGTLTTSFDEDRARDRRDDRIRRRSNARKDRRSDARRRNGYPPASEEEDASSSEAAPEVASYVAADEEASSDASASASASSSSDSTSSSNGNDAFPAEMSEEDRNYDRARDRRDDRIDRRSDLRRDRRSDRRDRIDEYGTLTSFDTSFDSDRNGRSSGRKKNASQKRQDQRDNRRAFDNPNRSQREEQNERERKHRQSRNRSNRCVDPSEPGCGNDNYPRNREEKRNVRCNRQGRSCNYHRSNPGDEPNRRRAVDDVDCIDDCRDRGRSRDTCSRICAAEAELALE